MSSHHLIQQCVQDCHQVMNKLQNITNQVQNQHAADMLREGAHHLQLCVDECNFAAQRVSHHAQPQAQGYQGAPWGQQNWGQPGY